MKSKILFFILLSISHNLLASSFLTGKGRYMAQEGEKLSFIKDQLLYEATRDIITQQLLAMHLDKDKFWNSYDLKFADFFAQAQEEFMAKHGINSEEELEKHEQLKKQLQHRKRYLLSRFGRLRRVLSSYVIKRMSHSKSFNHVYHITILAKVDKDLLSKKYLEFTQQGEGPNFKTLYIRPIINLKNLAWPEVGVDVVADFKRVVFDYWVAWLTDNFQEVAEKVVLVDAHLEQQLKEFKQLDSTELLENSPFVDGILLNLSFDITKLDKDAIFHRIHYRLGGRINFIDLNDLKVITFADLLPATFLAQTNSEFELSSNVATNLYKFPLAVLKQSLMKIQKYNVHKNSIEIGVEGLHSVSDLFRLKKFLERTGVSMQLEVLLNTVSINKQQATLRLWFDGTLEQFQTFLHSVDQRLLRPKVLLKSWINEQKMVIKLLSLEVPEAPQEGK